MSAKAGIRTERVYVRLRNEGVEVARPTQAEPLGGDIYRLLPMQIPEGEDWEFPPGSTVRCVREVWAEGVTGERVLMARELISPEHGAR